MIADSGRFSKSNPCRRTTEDIRKDAMLVLISTRWAFLFWLVLCDSCFGELFYYVVSEFVSLLVSLSSICFLTRPSLHWPTHQSGFIIAWTLISFQIIEGSQGCAWYHASNEISNRTLSCEYETTLLSRPVLYSVVISFQTNETWLNLSNTNCQLTHACMYGTPIS